MKSKLGRSQIAVAGGGIVGLATALQFSTRHPDVKITVLEKEAGVARHQTGHNSGVLHSGIYYKPGSLKAVNCRAGRAAMQQFCEEHGIAHEICGKVIIAKDESEIPALERIFERGRQNQIPCEMIDGARLRELEPHVRGVRAIHVFETGIVHYADVCRVMVQLLERAGHNVVTGVRVTGFTQTAGVSEVITDRGSRPADIVINCTGLHCDRVARALGARPDSRIIPFRGEYYEVAENRRHLCRNLIYPVPDPAFPFLGVHFTRMIGGHVECGPNAVLAFAREGYKKRIIRPYDLMESLTWPGFLRMAARHWRMGCHEMWRSFSKRAFTRALQELIPEIQESDLVAAPAGVRAQAVARDGALVDDFKIVREGPVVHVLNAPSPAATSSLNIGRLICATIETNNMPGV